MEIERKWMVKGWPEESASLPLVREQLMRQGYVTVYPTVRIREEAEKGGSTEYILCFTPIVLRTDLSWKSTSSTRVWRRNSCMRRLNMKLRNRPAAGIPLIPHFPNTSMMK